MRLRLDVYKRQDVYRPAAIKQLQINGEKQGVEVFSMGENHKPANIAKAALEHAAKNGNNIVILDTAGRLHIDEDMMAELQEIKETVTVHQTILVVDAMTGQDAVNVASSFNEKIGIDGVIVTKLDGEDVYKRQSVEIAKKFNQESIKTPAEYLIARGATHRKPVGKEFSWQHSVICNILKNDFYVGDVVYGKYEKDSVGGKKHLKPRSEWKITYNHHEPIIEREIFEAVRETRGKTKPYIAKRSHVLQGKVVCEECGKALRYRNSKNPYFYCNRCV